MSRDAADLTLLAPITGVIVPLDDVPDAVFAERLAGDGVAIDPLDTRVVAPCEARVVQVHRAGHALTLDADGIEIVIHVGLDTVRLKGAGFTAHVLAGARVRPGDPLLTFDADYVAQHARSLLTVVLITGMDRVSSLWVASDHARAGETPLLRATLTAAAPEGATAAAGEAVVREVTIPAGTGVHARPAARVVAAVRQYTADVHIERGNHQANARSVVGIMALEIEAGEAVRVVARGADAAPAAAAVAEALSQPEAEPAPGRAGAATPSAGLSAVAVAEDVFRGVTASPGVAIGRVHRLEREAAAIEEHAADPAQERRTLDGALVAAQGQLDALRGRLEDEADAEHAAIFGAHRELLDDPELLDAAFAAIQRGASAAYAWQSATVAQAERLRDLHNPLFAGRAADLRDVGERVLRLLVGRSDAQPVLPPDSIIIAEDLTPSETVTFDRTRIRGFCTTMGSATSHVAILARGLGIPAIAGIDPRVLELAAGTEVLLDGDAATLHARPDARQRAAVAQRQQAADVRYEAERAAAALAATTRDGRHVEVLANLAEVAEAEGVVALGGDGVGLLRTEFLFMERGTAPDEDEQVAAYRQILRALGPDRPLVIRMLDVGGDKPLPYLSMHAEANPFLGERGIRLLLERPHVFATQARAILRVAGEGRVAAMLPMIAALAEWRAARDRFEAERSALGAAPVPLGIMVETPAAALLAERFAEEAAFFSIGTNDLTQYTLAMDRTNPRLAPQIDALHPAVLRLIELTVAGARVHGRRVAVCGALAADVHALPVLVGLGVHELSVSPPVLPAVKARIRELSYDECAATAALALAAGDGAEVKALVARRHQVDEDRGVGA